MAVKLGILLIRDIPNVRVDRKSLSCATQYIVRARLPCGRLDGERRGVAQCANFFFEIEMLLTLGCASLSRERHSETSPEVPGYVSSLYRRTACTHNARTHIHTQGRCKRMPYQLMLGRS